MGESPSTPYRSADLPYESMIGRTDSVHTPRPILRGFKPFPFHTIDYQLRQGSKLGSGCWSDVYLGIPTTPIQPQGEVSQTGVETRSTAPSSPLKRSRKSSSLPSVYAVKKPAMRSARAVLEIEATFLTYLSGLPRYDRYIVPFHGLDSRNGALVMTALPQSLDSYITQTLNSLSETTRQGWLGSFFPHFALRLLEALVWLHETAGIIHADIKPGNVLLSFPDSQSGMPRVPPEPLLTDFSAALPIDVYSRDPNQSTKSAANGGGTWDYLAPELLSVPALGSNGIDTDASGSALVLPDRATDTYALTMTLIVTITGFSPFDSAPNSWLRRDMAKRGMGWACAMAEPQSRSRIEGLSKLLHPQLQSLLEGGLADRKSRWSPAEMKRWLRKELVDSRPR